ncbi:MAG: glycosyltransferase [Sedimentisphaerales bacterium]|nr:glycosyltransferase [Sedimentisphaerales bacterium]
MRNKEEKSIAVLIPCFNEEQTIGKVIDDFRVQLPGAQIVVFDNYSTDRSAEIAEEHDAEVVIEPRQGKGFVVESMFGAVETDVYIRVDGNDTYPAGSVHKLIEPILKNRADMVVGSHLSEQAEKSFRSFRLFGHRLVCFFVNMITGANLTDIMSGYRAFNRVITQMIPVVSSGFEVETELSIQTLYYQRRIIEVEIPYKDRPKGSQSKLKTFRDGFRVLWKIFSLFRALKPLTFFGSVGIVFFILGLLVGIAPVHDYLTEPNHYVRHVPLAILATGLMILSVGSVFLGVLLHVINWRFREVHNVLTRWNTPGKRDY